MFDEGPEIGWQLAAADVAIVDISAMIYDRLAVGRPLLVTRPVDPEAEIDDEGYLSDCEWLTADAADDVVAEVERVRADDEAVARLHRWVRHHFGDTSPGAATARLHAAIERLLEEWDEWHDAERGLVREAYGEREDDAEGQPGDLRSLRRRAPRSQSVSWRDGCSLRREEGVSSAEARARVAFRGSARAAAARRRRPAPA